MLLGVSAGCRTPCVNRLSTVLRARGDSGVSKAGSLTQGTTLIVAKIMGMEGLLVLRFAGLREASAKHHAGWLAAAMPTASCWLVLRLAPRVIPIVIDMRRFGTWQMP